MRLVRYETNILRNEAVFFNLSNVAVLTVIVLNL
jgi:hypothetical protein